MSNVKAAELVGLSPVASWLAIQDSLNSLIHTGDIL